MSRTDIAFRVIDASPAKLYAAFVGPHAFAAWLPPRGMTGRIETFLPQAGGEYRLTLRPADAAPGQGSAEADAGTIEGVFVELVPNVRVVQRAAFESDDAAMAGTMTISWRFDPLPEGTRVTVTCENVPVGVRRKEHLAGLRAMLANLARFAE